MMRLKLDDNFCDLLAAFRDGNARYLIVGGWAVSIHAQPRATQDMDIFVSPEPGNMAAVYQALLNFGAPLEQIDKQQFLAPGTFFRIGAPPCQVDIFAEIPGVEFEPCWQRRIEVTLEGKERLVANVISADDLVAAKIASGREQDLADVKAIRQAQRQRRNSS